MLHPDNKLRHISAVKYSTNWSKSHRLPTNTDSAGSLCSTASENLISGSSGKGLAKQKNVPAKNNFYQTKCLIWRNTLPTRTVYNGPLVGTDVWLRLSGNDRDLQIQTPDNVSGLQIQSYTFQLFADSLGFAHRIFKHLGHQGFKICIITTPLSQWDHISQWERQGWPSSPWG